MPIHIEWSGQGEPVLFVPGWNTTAATVRSWIPEDFFRQYRCGILEWPGVGESQEDPLPSSLDQFLDQLDEALPDRPVTVVGFCLGGVAAWAFAQRHPGSARGSVMVESPLHFPLILAPLLVPGLGWAVLRLTQATPLFRWMVRRAILQSKAPYPDGFLDSLFAFKAGSAIHYLRIFNAFSRTIGSDARALPSERACWNLKGVFALKVLVPSLGSRHRVEAILLPLEGAGHFPAVEAPAACFQRIQGALAST